jgi:hypothetical protein
VNHVAQHAQQVAAVDAAVSDLRYRPLDVSAVVAFAASDAMPHLDDIRARCAGRDPDELATFIAIHFLTIGFAAGLAVNEAAQLESL